MAQSLPLETIPLVTDSDGVIRVGRSRVTLETIIAGFREGATAEELAQQYTSISLADIYQVIGYYLRHAAELEAYLSQRTRDAENTRRQNESQWNPDNVRQRLMTKRRR